MPILQASLPLADPLSQCQECGPLNPSSPVPSQIATITKLPLGFPLTLAQPQLPEMQTLKCKLSKFFLA